MIVTNILSTCCDASVRWLDCAECEEAGETCQLTICVECGADVDAPASQSNMP